MCFSRSKLPSVFLGQNEKKGFDCDIPSRISTV